MTSSKLGEDVVEWVGDKKGWRLNEVQIQDILKKTPKIPIKVLGADAKGVPSKRIAKCT